MVNGAELKPYAVISACAAPIVCRFEFNFHAIAMQCNNIHISIMSAFVVVAVSAAAAVATAAAAIWNACVCCCQFAYACFCSPFDSQRHNIHVRAENTQNTCVNARARVPIC